MKKKIGIIAGIVGILLVVIVAGGIILINNNKKKPLPGSKNFEKVIKEYSEYGNYKLTTTASMTPLDKDFSIDSVNESVIDVDYKLIKCNITTMDIIQYLYFDLPNNTEYHSSDNENWFKNTNSIMFLPDFSSLIKKIKTLNTIQITNDGEYKLTTSLEYAGQTLENIPVTVTFTEDGYLSKIVYDISSTKPTVHSYIMTYEIADVGKTPNIKIPDEIIKKAVNTNEITMINYFS